MSTTVLDSRERLEGNLAAVLRARGAITRLARGLPVGADLEHADEVTLGRALSGRRAVDGSR